MMKKNRKGQSTLEYAILIIIIIAALLSLQTYVKRGVQGRLKSATDDVGDQFSGGANYYKRTQSNSLTSTNNDRGSVTSGGTGLTTRVDTNMQMWTNEETKVAR